MTQLQSVANRDDLDTVAVSVTNGDKLETVALCC